MKTPDSITENEPSEWARELLASIDLIEAAERMIKEMRVAIPDELRSIATETPEHLKFERMSALYWQCPSISGDEIKRAFGFNRSTKPLPLEMNRFCVVCGAIQIVSSHGAQREAVKDEGSGKDYRCSDCTKRREAIAWEEMEADERAIGKRLRELKSMPYGQYLQTPEWEKRSASMKRSVGHRCQLCNETGHVLHVHHRTYERRGNEYFKDLIVLCAPCHAKHHDKLPPEE